MTKKTAGGRGGTTGASAGERATCGAKTRDGSPCKSKILSPNGRCRMHGGAGSGAPKGNANHLIHGIYSNSIRPGEHELYDQIPIGTVDDELRLVRLQLRRTAEAIMKAEDAPADPALLEIAEMANRKMNSSGGQGDKQRQDNLLKRVRPDWRVQLSRLLNQIAQLERLRLSIKQAARSMELDVDDGTYIVEIVQFGGGKAA